MTTQIHGATQIMEASITQDRLAFGLGASPPVVNVLPTTPTEGQEVYFVAANGSQGLLWHLRYSATRASWDYLGGPSLQSQVASGGVSLTETAYTLAYSPPPIVVPLAGVYDLELGVSWHFYGQGGADGICSADVFYGGIGNQVTSYSDGGLQLVSGGIAGSGVGTATWGQSRRTLAAGGPLYVGMKTTNQTASLLWRALKLTPVGNLHT